MSARGQLDREPRHRLAVELGREEVARRSQLDAADVAQRHRRPVWVGAQDDAFELPGLGEATLRRDHGVRSEEHTSELQSLMRSSYAVFCLKKKNISE